ncbi:hypothetical protein GCM10027414_37520 [Humibacter ginsengiterrae]
MNQATALLISFLLPIVVLFLVTAVVSSLVRRAPSTATWKATRAGVLFVVCSRRWQRVLVRTVGIAAIVIGCFLLLVALTAPGESPTPGMGIAAVVMAVVGILFVWLAHGMARSRLEVTSDTVWVFRGVGAPRAVAVGDIAALKPLASNNYGGVVARSATKRLFHASRILLGYPQLIEFLRARRPDLQIPDASWPL